MDTERELLIKWSGQEMKFTMGSSATVGELKRQIAEQTSVAPKRQKLLGLKAKNAKLASDEVLIEDLVHIATQYFSCVLLRDGCTGLEKFTRHSYFWFVSERTNTLAWCQRVGTANTLVHVLPHRC